MFFFMYIFVFGLLNFNEHIFANAKLVLHIDSLRGYCPGLEYAPVKLENVSFQNTENGLVSVKYALSRSRYIGKNLKLKLELRKCQSKEALDTCTKFANLNTNQVCRLLDINTEFYSAFTNCLKPRVICPITKGTSYGTNCTYNMDSFNMFPITGSYWKAKVELLDSSTKGHFFCGTGEGYVTDRN